MNTRVYMCPECDEEGDLFRATDKNIDTFFVVHEYDIEEPEFIAESCGPFTWNDLSGGRWERSWGGG